MKLPQPSPLIAAIFLSTIAAITHAQTTQLSTEQAEAKRVADILKRPLATSEDYADFEKEWGAKLKAAKAVSKKQREELAAAMAVRLERPDAKLTSALAALITLSEIELLKSSDAGTDRIVEACDRYFKTFKRNDTIAWSEAQVAVYLAGYDPKREIDPKVVYRYTPQAVLSAYEHLAQRQRLAGQSKEAVATVDKALGWEEDQTGLDSNIHVAEVHDALATLRREIRDETVSLDETIKAAPADPKANYQKAIKLLATPKPLEASPYLRESGVKPLQELGVAIENKEIDTPKRSLAIAQAAANSIPLVPDELHAVLLNIAERESKNIHAMPDATAAQKETVDAILTKSRQAAALSNVSLYGLHPPINGKIVFVVDHSGSMIDTFDFARNAIIQSVGNLSANQQFCLITFSEIVDGVFPHNGSFATPSKKMAAYFNFFMMEETRAQGKNDDLFDPFVDAMKRAFALKPTAIFFVTDGNFDPRLVEEIKKLNPKSAVQVNTLGFIKVSKEAKESLKTIAADNGGGYKLVTKEDLEKQ